MNKIVEFEFPLALWVPIESGSSLGSHYEIDSYSISFTLQFEVYDKDENDFTLINVKYLNTDPKFHEIEIKHILPIAIYSSIKHINRIFDAIRFTTNYTQLSNFSILDLPEIINVKYDEQSFAYATNPKRRDPKTHKEIIKNDEFSKRINILSLWDRHPEFEIIDKYHSYGKYHLDREEFTDAVIDLQTSFEVFIKNSLKIILDKKNEGKKKKKVYDIDKIPFRNIIEDHLSKYLKTDLSYDNNPQIKEWHQSLYQLRNDIIHKGHEYVNHHLAYKAYESYFNTRNYVAKLMSIHGYLDEDMNYDLKKYQTNLPSDTDHQKVIEELHRKNMLPKNVKLI